MTEKDTTGDQIREPFPSKSRIVQVMRLIAGIAGSRSMIGHKKTKIFPLLLGLCSAVLAFTLFFKFPDLDIRLLGIGWHRFFLFHSAVLPVLMYLLIRRKDFPKLFRLLLNGFCLGTALSIGIHLFFDLFQNKSVMFPFVGSLVDNTSVDDRLWIAGNSFLSFWISKQMVSRSLPDVRS